MGVLKGNDTLVLFKQNNVSAQVYGMGSSLLHMNVKNVLCT